MVTLKNIFYSIILFLLFNINIRAEEQKYLIIFSADWCHYCKKAQSEIEQKEVSQKISKVYKLIYIDYDTNKELVKFYKIKQIPTFILLNNDKEFDRQVGYGGIDKFIEFLGLQ